MALNRPALADALTEAEALRREIASMRKELSGKLTMLQWMLSVMFVMDATMLGIMIDKLL